MGRRKRRKIVKKVVRKIPKIFICPKCGKQSVFVNINKEENNAYVRCGSCELNATVELYLGGEPVDAYNLFVDKYYSGIIK
jgi:transcription elongation factor Elf1